MSIILNDFIKKQLNNYYLIAYIILFKNLIFLIINTAIILKIKISSTNKGVPSNGLIAGYINNLTVTSKKIPMKL